LATLELLYSPHSSRLLIAVSIHTIEILALKYSMLLTKNAVSLKILYHTDNAMHYQKTQGQWSK